MSHPCVKASQLTEASSRPSPPRQPGVRVWRYRAAGVRATASVQTCSLLRVDFARHLWQKRQGVPCGTAAADGSGPSSLLCRDPTGTGWGPPPQSAHSLKVTQVPCRCSPHPPVLPESWDSQRGFYTQKLLPLSPSSSVPCTSQGLSPGPLPSPASRCQRKGDQRPQCKMESTPQPPHPLPHHRG